MEYLSLIFRTTVIFMFILTVIRLLGKREVGELSIFDLVVLLVIADIGSMGIDEKEKLSYGVVCLIVLFFLQKIFSFLSLKLSFLRFIFDGNPRVLIKDGKIIFSALKKEKYTIDDLMMQLRTNRIMDVREVKLAVLETNGTLSIFREKKVNKLILPVIQSGIITKEFLSSIDLDEIKIRKLLDNHKLDLKSIILGYSDGKSFSFFYRSDNSKDKEEEDIKNLIIGNLELDL